jgi:hypothetical protein
LNLAFKDAELAGGFFSKAIKWKTGGRFSHVEMWLTGPRENAVCFSSREPHGTGYAHIDLSAPLFTCVEILATQPQLDSIRWFAEGTGFKRYDMLGILGFILPWGEHDDADVFCSEWCTLALQRCMNMCLVDPNGKPVKSWMTSPVELYRLVGGK